jgi:excisionase family DNA binding protein
MERLLYTIDDVAKVLGLSRYRVDKWIKEGRLKTVQISPRITRISSQELQRFIQELAQESARRDRQ